jgi:hypothetical protein
MTLGPAVQELTAPRASMARACASGHGCSVGDHPRFAAIRRRDAGRCAVIRAHRL